ncbi:MAG: septum formation initiator family protein [Spirochaetaceae bacterium]|jgi:cell division protein FtsB|nr:septum formation initiator family protein [Spirochaetaceae bacterium]
MRTLKYLFPVWLGIAFYCVAAIVTGPSGISAYKQLEAEKQKQIENIYTLNVTRERLEGLKSALIYDEDTISVYARDLGYGTADERFVRIVGLLSGQTAPDLTAGEVYIYDTPIYKDDKTLRIIALIIAAFSFFIILLVDVLLFIKNI